MTDHEAAGAPEIVTIPEMRRRRKAREALDAQVRDLAAVRLIQSRKTVADLAVKLAEAEASAQKITAVMVQLYGSSEEVSELTDIPVQDIESTIRGIKKADSTAAIAALRTEVHARIETNEKRRKDRRGGRQSASDSTAGSSVSTVAEQDTAADGASVN
ncbi:hypothetical protein [Streptomyces celluloflavus]|uniref:hypothetical protein n=1 Tax=Streptomyces celluloflavus TaxID=58344 RepID=UPI0036C05D77